MPWFAPPLPYDPPWPSQLQVFGEPSRSDGMFRPYDMEPVLNVRPMPVQPGRAKDSSRRCQPVPTAGINLALHTRCNWMNEAKRSAEFESEV